MTRRGPSPQGQLPYRPCVGVMLLNREGLAHVDAIKLDVEGAEDLVLDPFFRDAPAALYPALFIVANVPEGLLPVAPDLVVGYAKGTRASDESALGGVPAEVIVDNLGAWTGDHCMDPDAVPGILLTNRPLRVRAANLRELAPAILAELGIDGFPTTGKER